MRTANEQGIKVTTVRATVPYLRIFSTVFRRTPIHERTAGTKGEVHIQQQRSPAQLGSGAQGAVGAAATVHVHLASSGAFCLECTQVVRMYATIGNSEH